MNLAVAYSQVSVRYPTEVAKVMDELVKSKSKFKYLTADKLRWGFNVGWDCGTPYEGAPSDLAALYRWDLGRAQTFLMACVPARRGSGWRGAAPITNPPEVEAYILMTCEKQVQKALEYEKLSPEAKQKQFEDALATLQGQPGFTIIRL